MRSDSLDTLASELYGGYRKLFWLRLLKIVYISGANREAIVLVRLIRHFHQTKRRRLAKIAATRLRARFGCFVQPGAIIGPGLKMPHPNGIVIGKGVRIGRNCTIFQQVTLGGKPDSAGVHIYPVIGDDVKLFAGAKIVGGIDIGFGATVGANAVVLRDVPKRNIAVGVPSVNIAQDYDERTTGVIGEDDIDEKCENS